MLCRAAARTKETPLTRFVKIALAAWALASTAAWAQDKPIAFTGARVIPIAGSEIANGTVVVQNGKIVAVGATGSVTVPAGATRIDASGKVIMPGLVDSHSHIAGPEGGDRSGAFQPEVRILDSVNPRDARIQKAQAGGLTVANVMPGSGHLSSGQTLYLKLRDGRVVDDLLMYDEKGKILGGLKMANGTNPRRDPPFPGTRGKAAAIVRAEYIKAQEYRQKIVDAKGDASKMPARDLHLEPLVEVLEGTRVVQHHTHRNDDIMTVLRIAKEFGYQPVLHHTSEAWAVADEIAKAHAMVSLIVIDSPGGKLEAKDARIDTGAILEKAGVLVGLHTDDGITDSRWLMRSAALAVRAGMSREAALKAITINNAIMLGLQKRVGTLEPGKDADLVMLSGDPFSLYTHVLQTWVEGKKVFDDSDPKDHLYAVGGMGASHDQFGIFTCEDEVSEDQQ